MLTSRCNFQGKVNKTETRKVSNFLCLYSEVFYTKCACFGSTYIKIGTIQRRLAWPLRKDDTQKREAFHIFETAQSISTQCLTVLSKFLFNGSYSLKSE
jgi:hypothetical protein